MKTRLHIKEDGQVYVTDLLIPNQQAARELINYELYGGPQVDIPWSVVVKCHSGELFDIANINVADLL